MPSLPSSARDPISTMPDSYLHELPILIKKSSKISTLESLKQRNYRKKMSHVALYHGISTAVTKA